MNYVSPYLNSTSTRPSSKMRKRRHSSPADVLSDATMSFAEKHHALDKLENDALAAFTVGGTYTVHDKKPSSMLEEVMAARRTLHHEN